MRTRTLADLRQDIRLRADVLNADSRYSDAEVNEYFNQAWTKVYGLLAKTGENYYLKNVQFSTVANEDTYYTTAATGVPAGTNLLPTDMWDVKGLDAQINGPRWSTCQRSQFEDRNDYQDVDFAWPIVPLYDYRGSGDTASIVLNPMPSNVYVMRLWYYPAAARMTSDQDTIDGGNGWERMAVDIAARWIADRDENSELCARLDASIAEWEARIKSEAAARNVGQAPKVRRSMRYKRFLNLWPRGTA